MSVTKSVSAMTDVMYFTVAVFLLLVSDGNVHTLAVFFTVVH